MLSIPDLLTIAEQSPDLNRKRGILVALHQREYEFRSEEEGRRYRTIQDEVRSKLEAAGFARFYQG